MTYALAPHIELGSKSASVQPRDMRTGRWVDSPGAMGSRTHEPKTSTVPRGTGAKMTTQLGPGRGEDKLANALRSTPRGKATVVHIKGAGAVTLHKQSRDSMAGTINVRAKGKKVGTVGHITTREIARREMVDRAGPIIARHAGGKVTTHRTTLEAIKALVA